MPVDQDPLPNTVSFDDGKDAEALRTIGEVSEALGIKRHVLRYWEQQFPSLKPLKRSGGRRYYRPADVVVIQQIDMLVNEQGFTLKGARKALKEGVNLESLTDQGDDGETRRVFAFTGAAADAPNASTSSADSAGAKRAGIANGHNTSTECGRTGGDAGASVISERELVTQLKTIRSTLSQALEK